MCVLQKVEKCEESFCAREREERLSKQTSAKNFGRGSTPERESESKKKNSNNKKKANRRAQHKSVLKMGALDIFFVCFFCQFAA